MGILLLLDIFTIFVISLVSLAIKKILANVTFL